MLTGNFEYFMHFSRAEVIGKVSFIFPYVKEVSLRDVLAVGNWNLTFFVTPIKAKIDYREMRGVDILEKRTSLRDQEDGRRR
jgi:hypothetical protein